MIDKLRLQGNRFLNLALLNRDYWGGSLQQDHGWKSLFGFGDAALHLLGILPEAQLWAAYVIPRLRRSVKVVPRDGVIPWSSYCSMFLYLDEPTAYRQALLALTGKDIFDDAPFHEIVDYLIGVVREKDYLTLLESPAVKPEAFNAPKEVESKASVLRKGRNWVISASGGVAINSWAIADKVQPDQLNSSYIVPSVFDATVAPAVAAAVREVAAAQA